MKMNAAGRISRPCLRALLPLFAALVFTACKGNSDTASAAPPRDAGPTTLYALGSTTHHLRKAPSTDAEILEKLRIGTECIPLEPFHPGWRKVRCGGKEGYVSSFLLDPEKPSVKKLTADARNPQFTLAQREDAALGAATLAPEDPRRSAELGDLFFERNFELLAGVKKPLKGSPKLEMSCADERFVNECLVSSAGFIQAMSRRAKTKGRMFLVAVGDSEQVAVYRGQFRYHKKSQSLTAEVLERTRFEQTPVMRRALFPEPPDADEPDDDVDASSPRLGQFVLNESAQVLLGKLPLEWELLKRSEEGAPEVWLNGCNQRPYLLRLLPDLHGRWLAVVDKPGAPFPDERWVSAASRTKRGTTLMLSSSAEDTAPQVFEIPEVKDAPASLGETLYSSQPEKYSAHREPCGGDEAGLGPAFSGEFLPEKAMVALYGNFDSATHESRWAPSGAERERLKRFYDNDWYSLINGRRLKAEHYPKWSAYREGEQEKMLFLTSTYMGNVVALLGGGIFSKTEDGWRLERANRVMTMVRERPDFSMLGVGERGFIAVLTDFGGNAVERSAALVLISNLEGQEGLDVVGTIPRVEGAYAGACPWDKKDENASDCYSFASEWKFVPDPEHSLPELVVTTRGSRLKDQEYRFLLEEKTIKEIEPFHEVRVFAFRSGEYALVSRQDVP